MNNALDLLVIPIIVFLVYLIVTASSKRQKTSPETIKAEKQLAELHKQIEIAKQQLAGLQVDSNVQLTASHNNVLDVYERSGIKIQADILEGIVHMGLTDQDEIIRYIENQRHYWTQENRKKVFQ